MSIEIAWAAGLFEGEGCFTISHRKGGYGTPKINLNMIDKDVVEKFNNIIGKGKITRRTYKNINYSPAWSWDLCSRNEVAQVINLLTPYLGNRRRQRASDLLSLILKDDTLPDKYLMTDDEEVAWAAGLFEGEGSCLIGRSPRLRLTMTDYDVVERFYKIIGVGNLDERKYNLKNEKWKDQLCWEARSKRDIEKVLRLISPFFGYRRGFQGLSLAIYALTPHGNSTLRKNYPIY